MNILLGFFIIIALITLIDAFYMPLLSVEEEEQIVYPSSEVLKEDKRLIHKYLKLKRYRLTLSLIFDKSKNLDLAKGRTYFIKFKNIDNEEGKASLIIDNSGHIQLKDVKILESYRTLSHINKPKSYNELLAENTKYKSKLKEIKKLMRGL